MPRILTAAAFNAAVPGGGRAFTQRQTFTASGTFTPPTGVSSVWVTMIGGGGGGGGGQWVADGVLGASYASAGGSGGTGEVIFRVPVLVTPGTGVSVVVGAAGTAGANMAANAADGSGSWVTNTAVAGGNGGSSSFGSVSVAGGNGGGRTNVQAGAVGGAGGAGGNSQTAVQTITRLYADHATVDVQGRWGTRYRGSTGVNGTDNFPPNSNSLPSGHPLAQGGFFEARFTAPASGDYPTATLQPISNGSSGSGGWQTSAGSQAPRAGQAGIVIVEW